MTFMVSLKKSQGIRFGVISAIMLAIGGATILGLMLLQPG